MTKPKVPVFSLEWRAHRYFEVNAAGKITVSTSLSDATRILSLAAEHRAPGVDLSVILEELYGHAVDRHETKYSVARARGFHGVVAAHQVRGIYFLTWDHPRVVRGVQVLGQVDWETARKLAQRRINLVAPHRVRWPANQMRAGNVRPWRPLPADAEPWMELVGVQYGDVIAGSIVIHRWFGPRGTRWLVTFTDGKEVFGDHPNLERLLARVNDHNYLDLEVHLLHPDAVEDPR